MENGPYQAPSTLLSHGAKIFLFLVEAQCENHARCDREQVPHFNIVSCLKSQLGEQDENLKKCQVIARPLQKHALLNLIHKLSYFGAAAGVTMPPILNCCDDDLQQSRIECAPGPVGQNHGLIKDGYSGPARFLEVIVQVASDRSSIKLLKGGA